MIFAFLGVWVGWCSEHVCCAILRAWLVGFIVGFLLILVCFLVLVCVIGLLIGYFKL